MTRFQALFIKLLRVRWDYSWRAVHAAYQVRYINKESWWFNPSLLKIIPDKSQPHGNQIVGMDLCNDAINMLGEKVEDGWN